MGGAVDNDAFRLRGDVTEHRDGNLDDSVGATRASLFVR
jgi:hypothetical protein